MKGVEDLDPALQALLVDQHRRGNLVVGIGAKSVIVYVKNRQVKKLVESKISEEYVDRIQVELTGRIRPAHGTSAKNTAKR